MTIKITTTSMAARRLVACPDPIEVSADSEALAWLADRLRAEAPLADSHRQLAARFNEIRRTGHVAVSKVA